MIHLEYSSITICSVDDKVDMWVLSDVIMIQSQFVDHFSRLPPLIILVVGRCSPGMKMKVIANLFVAQNSSNSVLAVVGNIIFVQIWYSCSVDFRSRQIFVVIVGHCFAM